MQKTRLGVSVGLLCAAIYLIGLFDELWLTVVLVGYALLFEENIWLKKNAVKAMALLLLFSLATAALNLIPGFVGFLNNIWAVFNSSLSLSVIDKIIRVFTSCLGILKTVLFLVLGIKAVKQSTVNIPFVDGLINKYMA